MRRFGLQTLGRGFSHVFIKKGLHTDLQNAHDHRGAPALLEAILRAKWRLARAEKRETSREMRSINNSGMNPTMSRKTIRWVEPVLGGTWTSGQRAMASRSHLSWLPSHGNCRTVRAKGWIESGERRARQSAICRYHWPWAGTAFDWQTWCP